MSFRVLHDIPDTSLGRLPPLPNVTHQRVLLTTVIVCCGACNAGGLALLDVGELR